MTYRAETIWTTYKSLRRDVVLGGRCSPVCNETLTNFAIAMASFYSVGQTREMLKNPKCLRYLCDESLRCADRVIECAVTSMA